LSGECPAAPRARSANALSLAWPFAPRTLSLLRGQVPRGGGEQIAKTGDAHLIRFAVSAPCWVLKFCACARRAGGDRFPQVGLAAGPGPRHRSIAYGPALTNRRARPVATLLAGRMAPSAAILLFVGQRHGSLALWQSRLIHTGVHWSDTAACE
jgi:hypothetical protein